MALFLTILSLLWLLVVAVSMRSDWVAGFFLPVLLDDDELGMSIETLKGGWDDHGLPEDR